jgi:hypothetical protein
LVVKKLLLTIAVALAALSGSIPAYATGVGAYNVRGNEITGGANGMRTQHTSWLYYDGDHVHAHCFGTNEGNASGNGITTIVVNKCNANIHKHDGTPISQYSLTNGPVVCGDEFVGDSCVGNSTNARLLYYCNLWPGLYIEVHDKITVYYNTGGSDTSTHDAGSTTCGDILYVGKGKS